jgi:hypothetical protein
MADENTTQTELTGRQKASKYLKMAGAVVVASGGLFYGGATLCDTTWLDANGWTTIATAAVAIAGALGYAVPSFITNLIKK